MNAVCRRVCSHRSIESGDDLEEHESLMAAVLLEVGIVLLLVRLFVCNKKAILTYGLLLDDPGYSYHSILSSAKCPIQVITHSNQTSPSESPDAIFRNGKQGKHTIIFVGAAPET